MSPLARGFKPNASNSHLAKKFNATALEDIISHKPIEREVYDEDANGRASNLALLSIGPR